MACLLSRHRVRLAISRPGTALLARRGLRIATRLPLEQCVKHCGPPTLEVAVPLESAIQQSLNSLLRFRPRQRGLKGGEGVEKPFGGWQRDLVNEILRRC